MLGQVALPLYDIYRIGWTVLDWLYPPICGGCGAGGNVWCHDCRASTQPITERICHTCGDFIIRGYTCTSCQEDPPHYHSLRSYTKFAGSARKALHRLKYGRDISLGVCLAQPMIDYLLRLSWKPDIIIPIPISKERYLQRGYNQSAFLALPLALGTSIKYSSRVLYRNKATRTQVGLNIHERRHNVDGAFACDSKKIESRCILLVDDVITSGATMRACAQTLINNGASRVYGLSFARATYRDDDQIT